MSTIKRKFKGGFLAFIGYLLSPLSFWNDLFINIPLAYVFALPFGFISKSYFLPAMVLGYWLTNIVGFILLHKGARDVLSKEDVKYEKKELAKDLLLSLAYTGLIIILVKLNILRIPIYYFER